VSSGRRLSFSRAERGKRTIARVVNSSRKFDNWTERERETRGKKIDQNSAVSVSLSLFWWSKREEKDEKKITNLRVVDELGVAVAGGDGHVLLLLLLLCFSFSLPQKDGNNNNNKLSLLLF